MAAICYWNFGRLGDEVTSADHVSKATTPVASAGAKPTTVPEFEALFSGSHLDRHIWDTCYPWLKQQGCNNFGNKEESEWYLPSQVKVYGGLVHLVAHRQVTHGTNADGDPKTYYCRSGMITSYPGFNFEYGDVQIVAWIPASPGLWPAIWLDPSNLQWPPEMDMVESWGDDEWAGSFFHPYPKGTKPDRGVIRPASLATGWHTFGLSWTQSAMTWTIDGRVTLSVHEKIPHQKMFIIADLASYQPVGGVNECKGSLLIRSVKVWRS